MEISTVSQWHKQRIFLAYIFSQTFLYLMNPHEPTIIRIPAEYGRE